MWKEHHYAYISNSSNLRLAIFLQQLMTTRAYYMMTRLLIMFCARGMDIPSCCNN